MVNRKDDMGRGTGRRPQAAESLFPGTCDMRLVTRIYGIGGGATSHSVGKRRLGNELRYASDCI